MAKITVLMPVYNGETYLRETMDSVLAQTYSDFVFLIINDGSTDQTEQIILSYQDSRILYCKNDKNLGLVATLNKGVDLVHTEYLARMDADDLWVETKLEEQLEVLDSRTEVGICGTSIHKFGAFEADFIFPIDNERLKVGFLFYCCMSHPSVVFRMSFLKESGLRYKADYFPAEDYKMWTDCLNNTQIYNIPEILLYYRQHDSQITQDSNTYQLERTNKIRLEMLDRIYPHFNEQEKKFHLETFVAQNIHSVTDYRQCIEWGKNMQSKNRKNGYYIQPQVLREELNKYIEAGYKKYVVSKYFSVFSMTSVWKYACSCDWRYLSPKRNLSLFYKCIF